jgi:hypothetical protein
VKEGVCVFSDMSNEDKEQAKKNTKKKLLNIGK